jgi:hypothetical protein
LNFSDLKILTKAVIRAYDAGRAFLSSLTDSLNSQGIAPVNDLSAMAKVNYHPHSGWLGFSAIGRKDKSTQCFLS